MKKIGIVKLGALGDVIWTLPLVQQLLQNPENYVTWFIGKPFLGLVSHHTRLQLVPLDKPRNITDYGHIINIIQDYQFHFLLCLQTGLRMNILYPFFKARQKWGFSGARAKDGHTLFVDHQLPDRPCHQLDILMDFYQCVHHKTPAKVTAIPIAPQKRPSNIKDPYICIAPLAQSINRMWPLQNYLELAERIHKNYPNYKIVILGHKSLTIDQKPYLINKSGQTSIEELSAPIQYCSLFIGNDSGPIHMADAYQRPLLGLYAVVPSQFTGPYLNQNCIDTYPKNIPYPYKRLRSPEHIAKISVEEVFLKVIEILTSNQ